ncbi:MAG: lytic transglycosylase domain-containing protein [Gemmatimonadota bacterium]|nr:lytic transglycosylase domain-containing protein [Gemmatimonadota bacterium]
MGASHPGWFKTLSAVSLLAILAAWTREEPVQGIAMMDAISVSEAPTRTLPLESNARVDRWVHAFETSRRPEFERLMSRRALFSDMIRSKLRERDMPEELLYIPVIESGLSPFAVSRVAAVGLWQFMSPTAMQYGLRVDEYVDERRDPVRATDAALDYLSWLHDRFGGSWYLAAAAFNAGPGRVERIVNRHADGRMEDDVFWEILEYLPRETREYVPKMIAVTMLAREIGAGTFYDADLEPYRYDNVFVPGNTTLRSVARALDIETRVLRYLNPHLIRGVTPPGEIYGVRVPVGAHTSVVEAMSDRSTGVRADD